MGVLDFTILLVFYREPMTIEELQNILPNFEAEAMIHQAATLGVEPLNLTEDMTEDEGY